MPATRPRCRGLALIVVLWASVLMVLLAASFAFSLRTEARLASGVIERAAADAAAQAGLRRLLAVAMSRDRRASDPVHGSIVFDGIHVELSLLPENRLVDLNAAPPQLLQGLVEQALARAGSDAVSAKALTDAILDWRDADDTTRPEGAEAAEYEAAGLTARPRNGAFLSVSELRQVKGMEARVYEALRPDLTVYAWSPQVDPMSASRTVLLALPGLTPEQVDAFLAVRGEDTDRRTALTMLAGAGRYMARSGGTVYSVMARARTPAGGQVSRRAVVKLSANARQPYTVLAWFVEVPEAQGEDAPGEGGSGQQAGGS